MTPFQWPLREATKVCQGQPPGGGRGWIAQPQLAWLPSPHPSSTSLTVSVLPLVLGGSWKPALSPPCSFLCRASWSSGWPSRPGEPWAGLGLWHLERKGRTCSGLPALAAHTFRTARLGALGKEALAKPPSGKEHPGQQRGLWNQRPTDSYVEESSLTSRLYCLICKMRI